MSDLRALYEEVLLDHYRKPRNKRKLATANRTVVGHNPLCGDQIVVYVDVKDGLLQDVSFEGTGCAISTASASMMTTSLKGKTKGEVEQLFDKFHELLLGRRDPSSDPTELGKLAVFAGVCAFPIRVKCASLAWHTLRAAIAGQEETVSTE